MDLPFSPIVRPYPRDHFVPAHDHGWPQLLYATSGLMQVETALGVWVVPPQWAVWLPPKCLHETRMLTDVNLSSLHLPPSSVWSDRHCEFIEMSPLLRELLAVLAEPVAPGTERRRELVAQLMIEELTTARTAGQPVPMPEEPRLRALCRKVLLEPAAHETLDGLAESVGIGPKTAARLFQRGLGMSFRRWRESVHVANAQAYFAQGLPVKSVASLLGYTPSAFSVMMRRHSGVTPKALKGKFDS